MLFHVFEKCGDSRPESIRERHDVLKRMRSDRHDAVCAQSRFPEEEFKDVVVKGSAPRFGDLMKMVGFLVS